MNVNRVKVKHASHQQSSASAPEKRNTRGRHMFQNVLDFLSCMKSGFYNMTQDM